jgi:hypothetical protein
MRRFLAFEWEAIAGIIAAVTAIVLHFLHVVEPDVLLVIAVVLIAVLFVRDIRREGTLERVERLVGENRGELAEVSSRLSPPDAVLVGPGRLRQASEEFARRAQGEMIWFHVCLRMFKPQALFDSMLRPAIENPQVRTIRFVLDEGQRSLWEGDVAPKLAGLRGRDKVVPPRWVTIEENVSAIIADVSPGDRRECLLSFWGEPFMARTAGRDVPRYIFHVQGHSELVGRLVELERKYRLAGEA